MTKAFIVCGSPGAGKSTYSRKLASEKKAVLLDIDSCTETLVRLSLQLSGNNADDRDSQYFKDTYREAIYETLFRIAKDNLTHTDVIITGPFTKELAIPDWNEKLENRLKAQVEIHYLYCPPDELRRRLESRNNARDKAKLQDWDAYIQYYSQHKMPVCRHTLVDT